MQVKVGDMENLENDPTTNRNSIGPPNNADEEVIDGNEEPEEAEEYPEAFLEEALEFETEEFSALNNQLDQLQSALDEIESRNANIHKELLEILYSNREVRKTIREEKSGAVGGSGSPSTEVPETANTGRQPNSSETESPTGNTLMEEADGLLGDTRSLAAFINSVTADIEKL